MKYSYNWIQEITKTGKNPQELIDLIGLKGFEFDGAESLARRFEDFVVGEVLTVKKHPKADRLNICQVSLGNKEVQIVCGAPNVAKCQKVPVAQVGAKMPKGGFEIKKTKLRGVDSSGMICAEDELGLGKDHEGIMVLDERLKPGQLLVEALDLADEVLEFDILPNRAHDCLSYEGFSREVMAMEGRSLELKEVKPKKSAIKKKVKVIIEDKESCPRYIGGYLENIQIGPSPTWMRARLIASGMEPINNIVDITNYVMLEVGNPLHAFDFDLIESGGCAKIEIRKAKKNEKMDLLAGKTVGLNPTDLIIANKNEALALAGIKGGEKGSIREKTTRIVLEAANFNGFDIRKTRQRHNILTESQARFEKSISPALAERAFWRAVELLEKYACAKFHSFDDANYSENADQVLTIETKRFQKLLGRVVTDREIEETLNNLGFRNVKKAKTINSWAVPYWRLDIESWADLVEEIGRIGGYSQVKPIPLEVELSIPKKNKARELEWQIRDFMEGIGFDEVLNYSFYSENDSQNCLINKLHYKIANPLSEELTLLRRSFLPGMLGEVAKNSRYFDSFSLFEIGKVYFEEKGEKIEESKIAGIFFDKKNKEADGFYKLKGSIQALFERFLSENLEFLRLQAGKELAMHPARLARINFDGQELGFIGQVKPAIAKKYHIKEQVFYFELNLAKIIKLASEQEKKIYQSLAKFPQVYRDLSLVVDEKAEVAQISAIIKKLGGKYLQKVELFDVFQKSGEKQKSMAFHLVFGSDDCTLEGGQVDQQVAELIEKLRIKNITARV